MYFPISSLTCEPSMILRRACWRPFAETLRVWLPVALRFDFVDENDPCCAPRYSSALSNSAEMD